MIVDWTDEEMDWIEKWTDKKPGLPIKEDCPKDIRTHLEERFKLLRVKDRKMTR